MVVEPVHQQQIVGEAAKEDHRHVGVGVDEAGQYDAAAGIDARGVGIVRLQGGGGPDGDDLTAGAVATADR